MVTYAKKRNLVRNTGKPPPDNTNLDRGGPKTYIKKSDTGNGDELELPTHVQFQQTDQFS
jgi:hypothetical protein